MSSGKKENKFDYYDIILISFTHLMHDVYSSFLSPVLPLLIAKHQLSYAIAGILPLFQRLPSILNPFVGLLADRFRLKYILILAAFITITSMSFLGAAPNLFFVIIVLLLMGLGASFFHVPGPVIVKQLSGKRAGLGMGFFMFGGEAARTLGPIYILTAISVFSFEGTWRLCIPGFIIIAYLFFRFKKLKFKHTRKDQKTIPKKSEMNMYLRMFFLLGGFFFFFGSVKSTTTHFLPTYLTEKGNSLWAGGIALSVLQLSGAAGTLISGHISDKIGRFKTLFIVALLSPFFLFMLTRVQHPVLFYFFLVLLGITIFSATPVWLAIINENFLDRPAFTNGSFMTIQFLISSIAIILSGWLSDKLGLDWVFQYIPFLGLGALPFVLFTRNEMRKINQHKA